MRLFVLHGLVIVMWDIFGLRFTLFSWKNTGDVGWKVYCYSFIVVMGLIFMTGETKWIINPLFLSFLLTWWFGVTIVDGSWLLILGWLVPYKKGGLECSVIGSGVCVHLYSVILVTYYNFSSQ